MKLFRNLLDKHATEKVHAKNFFVNALTEIRKTKNSLPNNQFVKEAIRHPEFDYWATLVALRAADSGAIMKYGIENRLVKNLLEIMTSAFQSINPYVIQNLQYNQQFIQDLINSGRINSEIESIPEANGFWLLYSLGLDTLDYSDQEKREAAKTIGNWLFNRYTKYWEEIPSY